MQINVVKNGKKNLLIGFINRIILLLCPFIERTLIIRILGAQYLGLGSLFSSVLSVLSITELGFGGAVVYHMYKPVAEGDTKKVNALLAYYRKAYHIIGFAIFGLGIAVIPFLRGLIQGTYPENINLIALYMIYLVNSCISYFMFSYLDSILVVYQREDIKSTINSVVKVVILACQITVLLLTKNYYLFALFMPVLTMINHLWTARRVRQLYPQYRAEGSLLPQDRAEIRKLVTGTFVQSTCTMSRNSLDNICISAFLGLTLTAIYNNYFMVFSGLIAFVGIINASFIGGIGNHVATRSVEENYEEMKKLDFVYLWFGGWCTICLLCLYQPFMQIWMGKELMLPFPAVCLMCLYFYLLRLGDIRFMYLAAKGLWWEQRYRAIGETITNLVLNIALGKLFGVYGIISATIISLFFCNYIWSNRITFKHYFSTERLKDYYQYQGKQSIMVLIACLVTLGICEAIKIENLLIQLAARVIICVIVPNALFYLAYRKTERFDYAKRKIFDRHSASDPETSSAP